MTTTAIPTNAIASGATLRNDGYSTDAIRSILGATYPEVLALSPNALNNRIRRYQRQVGMNVATRRYQRIVAEAVASGPFVPNLSRRFGVEIEVKGIGTSEANRVINGLGIACVNEGYDHRTRSTWKVTYDGSLTGTSAEVVSPPLAGDDGIAEVVRVVAALREAGARIDRQCGLHVHHEVIDLTGSEVATLIEMYAGCQADLDGLVAPSRRRASYCRHLPTDEVRRYADAFRTGINRPADAARYGIGQRPDSRYRVLNVHSYGSYGTLEFRQHQGTLSGSKVAAWIRLGQAMVEAARANTAVAEGSLLANLADAGHLDSTTAAFLTRRSATLA